MAIYNKKWIASGKALAMTARDIRHCEDLPFDKAKQSKIRNLYPTISLRGDSMNRFKYMCKATDPHLQIHTFSVIARRTSFTKCNEAIREFKK